MNYVFLKYHFSGNTEIIRQTFDVIIDDPQLM